MRKRFVLATVAAVAAIAVVWSVTTLAKPKGGTTEASAPLSPHDIMVKQGSSLPVEYWTHPY
jgi:hypothetical protein